VGSQSGLGEDDRGVVDDGVDAGEDLEEGEDEEDDHRPAGRPHDYADSALLLRKTRFDLVEFQAGDLLGSTQRAQDFASVVIATPSDEPPGTGRSEYHSDEEDDCGKSTDA